MKTKQYYLVFILAISTVGNSYLHAAQTALQHSIDKSKLLKAIEAVRHGDGDIETIRQILSDPKTADVNAKDKHNITALMRAAQTPGHTDIVRLLIKAGALVNEKDDRGYTALLQAVGDPAFLTPGNKDIVRELIAAGADVNARDDYGNTALLIASWLLQYDIMLDLINAGADVNFQNKDGNTALMLAGRDGRMKVLQILIHAGADVNIQDTNGYTALMRAAKSCCFKENMDIVQPLVAAGADLTLRNKQNKSARDLVQDLHDLCLSVFDKAVEAGLKDREEYLKRQKEADEEKMMETLKL